MFLITMLHVLETLKQDKRQGTCFHGFKIKGIFQENDKCPEENKIGNEIGSVCRRSALNCQCSETSSYNSLDITSV